MKFLPSLRRRCLCLALLLPAAPLPVLYAAEPATVSLNFVNADLEAVVRAIGVMSGRNFLLDPRVKGTLNIVSAKPVPRQQTYPILLSALRLQGYVAVEGKGVTKIVPEADGKLHSMPVAGEGGGGGGDRLVTQIFTIKHESAAQLVAVLRPLISPNNPITAYPNNNTLVITDYAENLARIGRVIDSIDVAQGEVQVLPLQHASAVDLAATLSRLLVDASTGNAAGADPSQRLAVLADPRSNSLLLRSDNPSKLAAAKQLASALDQPGAAGNMHVIYLRNAEAAKVAQTLRAVLAGEAGAAAAAPPASGAPAPGGMAAAAGTPASVPTGPGIVQADVANNALIITAPAATYNSLRRVIDQLDRRRAQVYVEALIAEISAERAAEWGIQWQAANGLGSAGNARFVGGTSFGSPAAGQNILGAAANLGSLANGANLLAAKGTIDIPGLGEVANLALLARFLESETKANILSTPTLVTLDNEEARIVIGQNLPFITGQYSNTGGGSTPANPFQTIERRDVGLTLKIRPQISEAGTIKLQLAQEASSVVNGTVGSTTGPVTNKRSLESTVLVDDGAVLVLGGLVQDSYEGGEEKVPLLGDIPLLGALFRYDTRRRTKTNLMIFLRPKILRDREAYAGLTADRYDYVIGQQEQLDRVERLLRGEPPGPRLPPQGAPPPTPDRPAAPPGAPETPAAVPR